jgi:hypothetical protein
LAATDYPRPRTSNRRLAAQWDRFGRVLSEADSAVKVADLPTRNGHVKTADFAKWAEALTFELPARFPDATKKAFEPPASVAPAAPTKKPSAHLGRWPWGTYETPLLKHVAAAAEHFWAKGYDPKRAPTNPVVAKWLRDRGVPKEGRCILGSRSPTAGHPARAEREGPQR